ncbi:MAG: arsenate reductase ArsC [Candidatus Saganbacteria bacterium]|nr:arsenate reductase ArsC [Candidatus Saganbacteria bacterium]
MAKKKILFACVGNCCRSQMSEGFGRSLAGDKFEIYSAGSNPAGFVHPEAIAAMAEVGIDISGQYSKGFMDLPVKEVDVLVTMGCGETCPAIPAKQRINWEIKDPIGLPIDVFRKVRDDLRTRIEELFKGLYG